MGANRSSRREIAYNRGGRTKHKIELDQEGLGGGEGVECMWREREETEVLGGEATGGAL